MNDWQSAERSYGREPNYPLVATVADQWERLNDTITHYLGLGGELRHLQLEREGGQMRFYAVFIKLAPPLAPEQHR